MSEIKCTPKIELLRVKKSILIRQVTFKLITGENRFPLVLMGRICSLLLLEEMDVSETNWLTLLTISESIEE